MPSSWWTIFLRKTGQPLKVIEREFSKFYEDVRLGSDNLLHLVMPSRNCALSKIRLNFKFYSRLQKTRYFLSILEQKTFSPKTNIWLNLTKSYPSKPHSALYWKIHLALQKIFLRNFFLNVWTYPVVTLGGDPSDPDSLDAVDIDCERITGIVRRCNLNELIFCVWNKMSYEEISDYVSTKTCPIESTKSR